MGAKDPFQGVDLASNRDLIAKTLSSFVRPGYDVYVLGLQEGVCEAFYDAVAMYTETYRLPLNGRVYPSRDIGGKARSRRMGRAIRVDSFIEDAQRGIVPDPVVSTADMVSRGPDRTPCVGGVFGCGGTHNGAAARSEA